MFIEKLLTISNIKKKYLLSDFDKKFIERARKKAKNIFLKKNKKIAIIVGPCSIHNFNEAILYAKKLKELQDEVGDKFFLVMRVYFEKARSKNSWKGFVNDPFLDGSNDIKKGIELTRKLLIEITKLNIPIACEILDINIFNYFDDLITWGFIGARTVESQSHRQLASSMPFVVGFKNPTSGDISKAKNAVDISKNQNTFIKTDENSKLSIFKSQGNLYSHIVLRGSDRESNYKMLENIENYKVMVDASHGNSNKDYKKQIDVFNYVISKTNNQNLIGIMLESNLEERNQKLDFLNLRFGISVTDECLSFLETKKIILSSYKKSSNNTYI
ncbi:MAG: Phospho-2-dehydro-3-deoxyheptonate aldolase, Tyr-sensitive [Candidatus Anoxychlamydiales bacterium]|nr:Phospho-2-dehydro-3-deoxyheptonate aldolase, Tyr-sensitive [Candidatus Anoxychlamydiales bacterium]